MKLYVRVIWLFVGLSSFAAALLTPSYYFSSFSTTTTTATTTTQRRGALYAKKNEEEFKKLQDNQQTFAQGNELKLIRDELRNMRESLMWAEAMHDQDRIQSLLQLIQQHEQRDPERVYATTLSQIAQVQGTFDRDPVDKANVIHKLQQQAQRVRAVLPRFQMEGLWVGAYGTNDLQLINITYRGDTLVATKTTGDTNVPRGQTSFTADLTPPRFKNDTTFTRFQGQGQVAQYGFVQPKYVNGQLILNDNNDNDNNDNSFAFVWYAERQHKVRFQRPTPQQTLHLLRDTLSREDELENMRTHLTRCLDLDATDALARQLLDEEDNDEPFRRIRRLEELEEPKKEWMLWKRYLGDWKNILNRKKEADADDDGDMEIGF